MVLVSGGKNDEVYIIDLKSPQAPTIFSPGPNTGVTQNQGPAGFGGTSQGKGFSQTNCVAWNSQVVHVVASGSSNGVVNVWDLRQKAAWCTLRDARGSGKLYFNLLLFALLC